MEKGEIELYRAIILKRKDDEWILRRK